MTPPVPYRPPGHGAVSPYLLVRDAAGMIEFLVRVFNCREVTRIQGDDGSIRHAAIDIDGSIVMVGARDRAVGNSTHLDVADVDHPYRECLRLGATSIREPTNFAYGDRSASVVDPFGNLWWLGMHMHIGATGVSGSSGLQPHGGKRE